MLVDELSHQHDSLFGGQVGQSNQTGMENAVQVDQFSKVGVNCYEHSTLCMGESEQGAVAGIGSEVPGIEDIVPFRP